MKIKANTIDIEVDISGPRTDAQRRALPVVLLIMGLGMQLTAWPPALVQALVDAGFCVVRFDNRDAGLSQRQDQHGRPNLIWASVKYRFGWTIRPPYSLLDMAADALGVLDALNIESAHVVGVSMGGMIAQRLALIAPARTLSLTSIMSTSSARGLPAARPDVARALLSRPRGPTEQDAVEHMVQLLKIIGSPGFAGDDTVLREQVTAANRRSYYPAGTARQIVAVVADSARAEDLHRITAPTLVIHGRSDPLVPFACGQDTARRIPGAQLVGIDGMGHDLPPGVVTHILTALIPHLSHPPTPPTPHQPS